MTKYTLYGIANCDTVKKARQFLANNHIDYEFVDFKKAPPTQQQIHLWANSFGELPVNKQGMTYRKYKTEYESLDAALQVDFIMQNASMIKRPILVKNNQVMAFGFKDAHYKALFAQ